jgi:hypothetical protein
MGMLIFCGVNYRVLETKQYFVYVFILMVRAINMPVPIIIIVIIIFTANWFLPGGSCTAMISNTQVTLITQNVLITGSVRRYSRWKGRCDCDSMYLIMAAIGRNLY